MIRCASAGVNRFDVDGSARRSYTVAGHVVWTERFCANTSRRTDDADAVVRSAGWVPNGWWSVGAEAFRLAFEYGEPVDAVGGEEGDERTSVAEGRMVSVRCEVAEGTTPSTWASDGILPTRAAFPGEPNRPCCCGASNELARLRPKLRRGDA